jgi:hypothetical protein
VATTVLFIALLASWIPARKAAKQEFSLEVNKTPLSPKGDLDLNIHCFLKGNSLRIIQ